MTAHTDSARPYFPHPSFFRTSSAHVLLFFAFRHEQAWLAQEHDTKSQSLSRTRARPPPSRAPNLLFNDGNGGIGCEFTENTSLLSKFAYLLSWLR